MEIFYCPCFPWANDIFNVKYPLSSLYSYVQVYARGYVILTDCLGLDFHKFSIVSALESHDYINDSHVPNGPSCYTLYFEWG